MSFLSGASAATVDTQRQTHVYMKMFVAQRRTKLGETNPSKDRSAGVAPNRAATPNEIEMLPAESPRSRTELASMSPHMDELPAIAYFRVPSLASVRGIALQIYYSFSVGDILAFNPSEHTSSLSAISASRQSDPEREVAQGQNNGSQGPRGSPVASHSPGDPVGRAVYRFRHGCGERGAHGDHGAGGGSEGDPQAGLDAGIGWSSAGSTDRQIGRRRRWVT